MRRTGGEARSQTIAVSRPVVIPGAMSCSVPRGAPSALRQRPPEPKRADATLAAVGDLDRVDVGCAARRVRFGVGGGDRPAQLLAATESAGRMRQIAAR